MQDKTTPPIASLLTGAAHLAGGFLGLGFAVTALLRRSKPLHPNGIVAAAVLEVTPGRARSGCPLLDEPGQHDCLVRASYAVGTGPAHADIEGFALRVLPAGPAVGPADVLFASTGTGPLGRHLLVPRPAGAHGHQTTLLPVEVNDASLRLRLDPLDHAIQPWPTRYELSWAHGLGGWQHFGTLTVDWGEPGDAPERFDPVAYPLPNTTQYAAIARLRQPAYLLSRLARPSAGRLPRPSPAQVPSTRLGA